jgi:predicted MPP superfamily phosphohydrolase
MKMLVIPDIHEAPNLAEVEDAIAAHSPDLTVFLGDYFDQWGDTPADAGRTAEWLANSLKLDKRRHLWGNHHLPYYLPGVRALSCPGWTSRKYQEAKRFMGEADWQRLTLHHWDGDWLFTHAGWSHSHCPGGLSIAQKQEYLDEQVKLAWS